MLRWPICGPKLSLCCSIISIWGIIQFILLGIFFYVQAVPLLDDFEIDENATKSSNLEHFKEELKSGFHVRAVNCWIAAGLYVGLLVFAGIQFRSHTQLSSKSNIQTSIASPFVGITSEENGYSSQHGIQYTNDQTDT